MEELPVLAVGLVPVLAVALDTLLMQLTMRERKISFF
jgi:hypothetical protein